MNKSPMSKNLIEGKMRSNIKDVTKSRQAPPPPPPAVEIIKLHESWKQICSDVGDPDLKSTQCRCWLSGAELFQQRALDKLRKQNFKHGVGVGLNIAIEIIKNLKAK